MTPGSVGGDCRLAKEHRRAAPGKTSASTQESKTSLCVESSSRPQETKDILTPPSLTGPPSLYVNGTNVTLHCNAGGQAVLNYTFIRDQQSVSCAQHHVTCSESSPFLYFRPIIESDSGNYTCTIQNPISSSSSSAPVRLSVAVSVSAVTLHSNASGPVLVEKDSVSLTCSALGTDVSFSWSLRGAPLPQNPRYKLTPNNSTLIISPVTRNDTGSFTCTASNSVNSDTSAPLNLTWSPDGHIVCAAGRPDQRVQLLCSWPGGYPAADLHLQFYNLTETRQDQVTINVSQDQITPDTELSCRGTQGGREETCALTIDTPQSAGFKNSSQVTGTLGKSVILTVTLTNGRAVLPLQLPASIPTPQILPANFTWSRLTPEPSPLPSGGDFTVESIDYGSRVVVSPVTESVAGRYQCRAENLMGSTSFIFILNVIAEKVPGGGTLSPGAIAGIVISVLAVVTLVPLTIVLILRRKNNKGAPDVVTGPPTAHIYENAYVPPPNIYETIIPGTEVQTTDCTRQEPIYQMLVLPDKDEYSNRSLVARKL
ncbi:cell adhesion molecule CEACAM1-like [Ascaphus truei]|uniref:cell adhesion molecule CEACAM1-like n=1 Tax=Ascaphus truei TaxID=8439 RepID=UPI003F5A28C2